MLKRIADVCYRHRWRVLIAWIVAFVAMSAVGGAFAGEFSQSFHLPKSDSQTAFDLLDHKFPARAGETAFIVFKAGAGHRSPRRRRPSPTCSRG